MKNNSIWPLYVVDLLLLGISLCVIAGALWSGPSKDAARQQNGRSQPERAENRAPAALVAQHPAKPEGRR